MSSDVERCLAVLRLCSRCTEVPVAPCKFTGLHAFGLPRERVGLHDDTLRSDVGDRSHVGQVEGVVFDDVADAEAPHRDDSSALEAFHGHMFLGNKGCAILGARTVRALVDVHRPTIPFLRGTLHKGKCSCTSRLQNIFLIANVTLLKAGQQS